MALDMDCHACGTGVKLENLGFARHPHADLDKEPIVRCKECHRKTKDKYRNRSSSYTYIE